jgi:hypothetical protein
MVRIVTVARWRRFTWMSDWYQASPKLPVKAGLGLPLRSCALRSSRS